MSDQSTPTGEHDSATYYYVCADGASNTPCPVHFPGAQPMPDNWMDEYKSPTPQGITDATSVGGAAETQSSELDERDQNLVEPQR